jgi:hypothetical protein
VATAARPRCRSPPVTATVPVDHIHRNAAPHHRNRGPLHRNATIRRHRSKRRNDGNENDVESPSDTFFLTEMVHLPHHDLSLRQTLRRWTTSTGIGGPLHRNTHQHAQRNEMLVAPIGSVRGCPDRRFRRRFASSSPTSPPRRPASNTWRLADGRMGSAALVAVTSEPMNCRTSGGGSVPSADTKFR